MKRGTRRLVLCAAALCFAGVAATGCSGKDAPTDQARVRTSQPATSAPGTTTPSTFDAARADELTQALSSHDADRIRPLLATTLQPDVEKIAAQSMPSGASLHIDTASFSPLGDKLGRVDGSVTSASGVTQFTFVVAIENGRWVLVGTTPKDAGS